MHGKLYGNIGKAAHKVLKVDMCLTLMPELRRLILEVARDVAYEESGDHADEFAVDEAASVVIHELCNLLTQSYVDIEDAPLLHVRQMKPRYMRAWFEISKPKP
jgi:hypothetical protein